MSRTMSSPSDQWGQFYNNLHQQQNQIVTPNRTPFLAGGNGDGFSDATVVTTAVSSATTNQNPFVSSNSSSTGAGNLCPEGRVSKPVRRRSRASRRTPTTLLNTDTSNFRAMVQQFTGGPSAPYGSGSQITAPNFSLALNPRQTHGNPTGLMLPGGFHVQYQEQQYQQPSNPSYMFSSANYNSTTSPGQEDHVFVQRLANPKPATEDGVAVDGSSRVVPSSSSNENRSNTFFF